MDSGFRENWMSYSVVVGFIDVSSQRTGNVGCGMCIITYKYTLRLQSSKSKQFVFIKKKKQSPMLIYSLVTFFYKILRNLTMTEILKLLKSF